MGFVANFIACPAFENFEDALSFGQVTDS